MIPSDPDQDGDDGVTPMHATGNGAAGNKRWRKANRPKGAFIWLTQELLESAAWSAMPLAARKIVERVMVEHMKHAGTRNGALIVTYDDFAKHGIWRSMIASAIETAVRLGFLDVTVKGRRSYGPGRRPSEYGLTWLPRCDGAPASNRWRRWRNEGRDEEGVVTPDIKSRPINWSGTKPDKPEH